MPKSHIIPLIAAGALSLMVRVQAAPTTDISGGDPLEEYVSTVDETYGYQDDGSQQQNGCTTHKLKLTSQTWHGNVWRHALYVYQPDRPDSSDGALLFVTGGATGGLPTEGEMEVGCKLAQLSGLPVAFLHQVPNQPLLDGRVEDDLVSETFVRFLATGDRTWPLLFPMVKSAVQAMTAVQDFEQTCDKHTVKRFILAGASKRGWTTWLTAAIDPRVAGIAPIVFDTLNFPSQMKHQLHAWGQYSEQIEDYTSKGLVDVMASRPEVGLWSWVDPYTYRERLTMPKLIVNGTNDRYWTVDASSLYWHDLVGENYLRYVPNAGHSLDGGREGALATVAAFARHVAEDRLLPHIDARFDRESGKVIAKINTFAAPKSVRLWSATSSSQDFREAHWESTTLTVLESVGSARHEYVGAVDKPRQGFMAVFGEATFADGPLTYSLSTLMHQE